MSESRPDFSMKGMKDVLLTLFVSGDVSQRQIHRRMKERIVYSQLLRIIPRLKAAGFIEVTKGKRAANICSLSDKGFYYVILYEKDIEKQYPFVVTRFFQVIFPKAGLSIPTTGVLQSFFVQVFENTVQEVRKRVNFDFFDGKYASWVHAEELIVSLYQALRNPPNIEKKQRRFMLQSGISFVKDASYKDELLAILKELQNEARKHGEFCKARESLFGKMIDFINNPKALTGLQ
jgi:DNA-binding PadR family transcriptional regulator